MEQVKAIDVLIPLDSYPQVSSNFTLRQTIIEMERCQLEVSGRQSLPRMVLVFDDEKRLVGVVRRRDILRGLGPNAMQEIIERAGEQDPQVRRDLTTSQIGKKMTPKNLKKRAERLARDVMLPIRVTINAEAPLYEVIQAMVLNNISMIPVLKEGKVIGVVRSADVLRAVGEIVI